MAAPATSLQSRKRKWGSRVEMAWDLWSVVRGPCLPGVTDIATFAFFVIFASCGCRYSGEPEVVVYTALDREFSEPVLKTFSRQTGIRVLPKYDTESTKTVGLANAILVERDRPRCDLFWNNEILNTLRLQRAGLLDVYFAPASEAYPPMYRSPEGTWHGFAGRARVLIVNTRTLTPDQYPSSIHDLVDPKWQGKVGVAKPLFGTTATHAACLFSRWSDERAKEFFRKIKNNARIESGNKQVALAVGRGQLAFGLTDTDDAIIELENGMPVEIVYPDQADGHMGTLFIPNTLGLIKGSDNSANARRLVDYLLSPAVESQLARGRSAQIPLNPNVEVEVRVQTPQTIRAMDVDFSAAADKWDSAAEFLRGEFVSAE